MQKYIRRGTTDNIPLKLPFDTSIIDVLFVTFSDMRKRKYFDKVANECILSGNNIVVPLSQEETLMFKAKETIAIQVRILTTDERALASNILTLPVADILKEGVI